MKKQDMIENLIEKYVPAGATTEEIIDMVEVGFENDLDPEIIFYNVDLQLSEEYMGE